MQAAPGRTVKLGVVGHKEALPWLADDGFGHPDLGQVKVEKVALAVQGRDAGHDAVDLELL